VLTRELIGFGGPALFFVVLWIIYWRVSVSMERDRENAKRAQSMQSERHVG
jgi:hypothetical protein